MQRSFIQIAGIVVVAFVAFTSFTSKKGIDLSRFKQVDTDICYYVPTEEEATKKQETPVQFNLFLGKTFIGFKEALAFKESQGRYNIINEFGYMGKYQFGKSTLQLIGIYNPDLFMKDSELQENAFSAYAARNKWILRRDIKRYVGRYVNGVKVTESGILAAAHLAGAGNVKKYLRSGGVYAFSDAFGTTIGSYLKKFSGYDTSYIVPNRKAKVVL